jgi:hypothetical protein
LKHSERAIYYSNQITDELKNNKIWAISEFGCDISGYSDGSSGTTNIGRFLNKITAEKKLGEIEGKYPFKTEYEEHISVKIVEQEIDICGDSGYWSAGMPYPKSHRKKDLLEAFETELENNESISKN